MNAMGQTVVSRRDSGSTAQSGTGGLGTRDTMTSVREAATDATVHDTSLLLGMFSQGAPTTGAGRESRALEVRHRHLEEGAEGRHAQRVQLLDVDVAPRGRQLEVDAAADRLLVGEAAEAIGDARAGADVAGEDLGDAVHVDEGVVAGVVVAGEVLHEHRVRLVEFAAAGGVVEGDDAVHLAAKQAEVLRVVRLREPRVVAEDDVVEDGALRRQLADDGGCRLLGRRRPEHDLDALELAERVKRLQHVRAEDGVGQVEAAVVHQRLVQVEHDGEHDALRGVAEQVRRVEEVALRRHVVGVLLARRRVVAVRLRDLGQRLRRGAEDLAGLRLGGGGVDLVTLDAAAIHAVKTAVVGSFAQGQASGHGA
mmetsp:Transcript_36354/g.112009  ORF Transcript_36354/g.112009 Transcript_36354/m.112009 type:complete len:367 (+) Transcript_36354:559-1659(+)